MLFMVGTHEIMIDLIESETDWWWRMVQDHMEFY